jgi:hypothetical protein
MAETTDAHWAEQLELQKAEPTVGPTAGWKVGALAESSVVPWEQCLAEK